MNLNTFEDYQSKALRTSAELERDDALLNGALGLAGESGEVIDLIKKHVFQGHLLDTSRIAEELGDVLWYISLLSKWIGIPMSDIAEGNIKKLEARYPENKFNPEQSIKRENG